MKKKEWEEIQARYEELKVKIIPPSHLEEEYKALAARLKELATSHDDGSTVKFWLDVKLYLDHKTDCLVVRRWLYFLINGKYKYQLELKDRGELPVVDRLLDVEEET